MNKLQSVYNLNTRVIFTSSSFYNAYQLPRVQPKMLAGNKSTTKQASQNILKHAKYKKKFMTLSLPIQQQQQFVTKTIVALSQFEQTSSDAEVEYF